MIYFGFNLSWPFKYDPHYQKNYFNKVWNVAKHKAFEIQISRMGDDIIGAHLNLTFKQDHAGLAFDLYLFRRVFMINFYDTRHWNYDKDRWVDYKNPEEIEEYR